jgi:hypothetical protein
MPLYTPYYKVVLRFSFLDYFISAVVCSDYQLKYRLREVTTAKPYTLGIMVFKELEEARTFRKNLNDPDFMSMNNFRILQVEGEGECMEPEYIAAEASNHLISICYSAFSPKDLTKRSIERDKSRLLAYPPPGTICFQSVFPREVIL